MNYSHRCSLLVNFSIFFNIICICVLFVVYINGKKTFFASFVLKNAIQLMVFLLYLLHISHKRNSGLFYTMRCDGTLTSKLFTIMKVSELCVGMCK